MLDAAAKPPPAILDGNLKWLGDYDECVAVRSNLTDKVKPFMGEYCIVGAPLPGSNPPNPVSIEPHKRIIL